MKPDHRIPRSSVIRSYRVCIRGSPVRVYAKRNCFGTIFREHFFAFSQNKRVHNLAGRRNVRFVHAVPFVPLALRRRSLKRTAVIPYPPNKNGERPARLITILFFPSSPVYTSRAGTYHTAVPTLYTNYIDTIIQDSYNIPFVAAAATRRRRLLTFRNFLRRLAYVMALHPDDDDDGRSVEKHGTSASGVAVPRRNSLASVRGGR